MEKRLLAEGYFGFEDLAVYQKAAAFAQEVYALAGRLPPSENFGLAAQLKRAAVSVPLNIAAGRGRGSDRDFVRFLYQARGSLLECVAALDMASRLGYLSPPDLEPLLEEGHRLNAMLTALIQAPARPRPTA